MNGLRLLELGVSSAQEIFPVSAINQSGLTNKRKSPHWIGVYICTAPGTFPENAGGLAVIVPAGTMMVGT